AVAALPALAHAQRTERFSLRSNKVAVYNVVGKVTVEAGSGSAVVVEVTREGADSRRIEIEQRTIDGRDALCIVFPGGRIIHHPPGLRGRFNTSTSTDSDCLRGRGNDDNRDARDRDNRSNGDRTGRRWYEGRRIEVRSEGDGVEAWADVRILVPPGKDL